MNKVIKGKRYDTSTAKLIGEYKYSNYTDFNHYCDQLYQKRTGEFFIYGTGGPLSKYAVTTGQDQWSGGENIIPISYSEAQEWAEKNLDADDYEVVFGKVDESTDKQSVQIRLTPAAIGKVKKAAVEKGIAMSDIIEDLIQKM